MFAVDGVWGVVFCCWLPSGFPETNLPMLRDTCCSPLIQQADSIYTASDHRVFTEELR